MKRAIISDIHGNLLALQSVLAHVKTVEADEIVCLGDICGYGPDPIACIDLVRASCKWVLCGNHDAALFMSTPIGFNRFAKDAIEWQRTVLIPHWYSFSPKARRWQWLANLPAVRKEDNMMYVHASPRDPLMEYVEEGDFADLGFGQSSKAIEIFDIIEWLAYCGHSHRPGVVAEDFQWLKPDDLPNRRYELTTGLKTLINVGSVGQPRDGNPDSCYVIHDTSANTITFHRVPYDIKAEQERFKGIPALHEKLWKRLEVGV